MTMMILTFALILLGWHLTLWRLSHSVSHSMETAVLATHQIVSLDQRPRKGKLTKQQQFVALAEAARTAQCLLGTWRMLLIRLSLGTWDVTDWLHAQLESTLWRLKHERVLPSSAQTLAPWLDGLMERVFDAVMKLYNLNLLSGLWPRPAPAPCPPPAANPCPADGSAPSPADCVPAPGSSDPLTW